MRFWDTSAIVPLVLEESMSVAMSDLLAGDADVVISAFTFVEAMSAIARRNRITPNVRALEESVALLRRLSRNWRETALISDIKSTASDLVFNHPLKAADALQLATALIVSGARPYTLPFVTLDQTLAAAARAEGFNVLP